MFRAPKTPEDHWSSEITACDVLIDAEVSLSSNLTVPHIYKNTVNMEAQTTLKYFVCTIILTQFLNCVLNYTTTLQYQGDQ